MEWYFSGQQIKESYIQELIAKRNEQSRCIAHCVRGNVLYSVWEQTIADQPVRIIAIDLLSKQRNGGWGHKPMDESCGPSRYDCPLSYLDMVPDPGFYATAWREKVRAFRASKRSKKP